MSLSEDIPDEALWLSTNHGETWKPFTHLPFQKAHRVYFHPSEPGRIHVTTFGGSVWNSPESP